MTTPEELSEFQQLVYEALKPVVEAHEGMFDSSPFDNDPFMDLLPGEEDEEEDCLEPDFDFDTEDVS